MGQALHHDAQQLDRREPAPLPTGARSEGSLQVGPTHPLCVDSPRPRGVLMWAKRVATVLVVVVLSTTWTWAADSAESVSSARPAGDVGPAAEVGASPESALPSTTTLEDVEPWIHNSMPEAVRDRLEAGFELALQRVREVPECSAMFADLDADAVETLRSGLYFPVASHRMAKVKCGRAMVYTYVGEPSTFLCSSFAKMTDERAATCVLHEALHHAGLTEKPLDRTAMTAREINAMVVTKCQL